MPRSVEVRAPGALPAQEAWREQFANDPLFLKTTPDLESVHVEYDPDIKKRHQQQREINREVRKLRTRPDMMRKFGAHASDETRKRREQERLEAEVLRQKAEKDVARHREREIAARLLHAEEHWEELSTGGTRKNPHLAARLIYTKLILVAKYATGGTGTVPADLRTPAAIATATRLSRRAVEQELAVLHDAGWVKVQGIRSVPGRRTYGSEITLPPVDNSMPGAGSVVHLLERMESLAWRMGSIPQRVLYVYFCTHPETKWNRREDQRYSPVVDRDALSAEAVHNATGLHRNSYRVAKRELVRGRLLTDHWHGLVILDPWEVADDLHRFRGAV